MSLTSQPIDNAEPNIYREVHIDLAVDMITSMFDGNDGEPLKLKMQTNTHPDRTKGLRKLYIQLLNKLYLPDEADENKLRKLKYLMSSYKMVCRSRTSFYFGGVSVVDIFARTVHSPIHRARQLSTGSPKPLRGVTPTFSAE